MTTLTRAVPAEVIYIIVEELQDHQQSVISQP